MDRRHTGLLGINAIGTVASVVIIVAGLKVAQSLCLPLLFAVLMTLLAAPALGWMRRRRVPTVLAMLLLLVVMLGLLAAAGYVVAISIDELTVALQRSRSQLRELTLALEEWLRKHDMDAQADTLIGILDPNVFFDFLMRTLRGLLSIMSSSVLVLAMTLFMLYESTTFPERFRATLRAGADLSRFAMMTIDVQRYLAVKTLMSILTGVLVGSWVAVLRIEFAFLWGFLAFLLNYIPVIGSLAAAVPALLLTLGFHGPGSASVLAAGYVVINIGVSNFLEPVIMGRRVNLSPLFVLLSLFFWGWVWGPVGMLLSVPLTISVKILLEHSETFSWIALLMDSRAPASDADESGSRGAGDSDAKADDQVRSTPVS